MKTPLELYKRFPYMFEGENIGIGISKGWCETFADLCAATGDEDLPPHYWSVGDESGDWR